MNQLPGITRKDEEQRLKVQNYLNAFKVADDDFTKTIPALNEFDSIGNHLRFLEDNAIKNQERIQKIIELLDDLNRLFGEDTNDKEIKSINEEPDKDNSNSK